MPETLINQLNLIGIATAAAVVLFFVGLVVSGTLRK